MDTQIKLPEGVWTMETRYMIIKENAEIYKKASKREKTKILNELEIILSMNRDYIGYLLRNTGKIVHLRGKVRVIGDPRKHDLKKRGRKKEYGEEVLKALKEIWIISGYVSSRHLVKFIRINKDILFSNPRIKEKITEEVKEKLLRISHSSIDRLLGPYREEIRFKRKRQGNPISSNVKKSVKVESWFEKPKIPGYVEIDLVQHSGPTGKGEFIYTLTATEITTGWTELKVLKNKAMIWTEKAIKSVIRDMPIPVKIIHSDNGSEFINAHIQRLSKEMGIEMTRSRPYKKNDSPYVECKNWSMVRAYTGYFRYDTEEELEIMKKLLRLVSLRYNLFIPQMKVVYKERVGRKIKKRYEIDTPLNRVLKLKEVDEKTKEHLMKLRSSIDIVKLKDEIEELEYLLLKAYKKKQRSWRIR